MACSYKVNDPCHGCRQSLVSEFAPMKIPLFALMAFGILAAGTTFAADTKSAYDAVPSACSISDDANLHYVGDALDYADQSLPNIPPEEERYLTTETSSALKVGAEEREQKGSTDLSDKRFNDLARRPLYYVWKVRQALTHARDAVANILTPQDKDPRARAENLAARQLKNDEAEKLQRAIYAQGEIDAYLLAMQDFITRIDTIQNLAMSHEQVTRIYTQIVMMPTNMRSYMSCKLAKALMRRAS